MFRFAVPVLLVISAIGIIGIVLYPLYEQYNSSAWYREVLSRYAIREDVFLGNDKVAVSRGATNASRLLSPDEEREALRLAYAAAAVGRSAPLALPTISLERFDETIHKFDSLRDQFAKVQKTPEDSAIARDIIFPTTALREFSILENKRRAFLQHPSEETLNGYLPQLTKALAAYKESFASYSDVFAERMLPGRRMHKTLPGVVTAEHAYEVFKDVEVSTGRLKKELTEYTRCLQGTFRFCNESWISISALDASLPSSSAPMASTTEKTVIKAAWLATKEFGVHVPQGVRVRIPSVCLSVTDAPFEYVVPVYDESDEFFRPVRELEEMFFLRLDSRIQYEDKTIRQFAESNAGFFYFALTLPHTCHEAQRDISRAVGVSELYAMLKDIWPHDVYDMRVGSTDNRYLVSDDIKNKVLSLLREKSSSLDVLQMHALEDLMLGIEYETVAFDKYLATITLLRSHQLLAESKGLEAPVDVDTLLNGTDGMYSMFLLFHPSVNPKRLPVSSRARSDSAAESKGALLRLSQLRLTESDEDLLCSILMAKLGHQGRIPSKEMCEY